jgi:hypothetical protein
MVREETHLGAGVYPSRMKYCHVSQYKQDLDIEPLSIAAMMGERYEKMNCKLNRTLFTIRHKTNYPYETGTKE